MSDTDLADMTDVQVDAALAEDAEMQSNPQEWFQPLNQARRDRNLALNERKAASEAQQQIADRKADDDMTALRGTDPDPLCRKALESLSGPQGADIAEVVKATGVERDVAQRAADVDLRWRETMSDEDADYWHGVWSEWSKETRAGFTRLLADPDKVESIMASLSKEAREDLLHARAAMSPWDWENFKAAVGRRDLSFH